MALNCQNNVEIKVRKYGVKLHMLICGPNHTVKLHTFTTRNLSSQQLLFDLPFIESTIRILMLTLTFYFLISFQTDTDFGKIVILKE